MRVVIAAASGDAALVFVELGTVALVLSLLAQLSSRLGITAIPLYLLAGLAVGDGGIAPLDVSADFIELAGEIGVLLLLLTLGLEYSPGDLRHGMRAGLVPGVVDAAANFTPGLVAGLVLGWDPATALLLGGVCWVSSSGVVSKALSDFDRLGNRETPAVLNLLVLEDLAMAVYLPITGAMVAGREAADTVATILIAVAAVSFVLTVALRWGDRRSALLAPSSDESLLLAVFGLTLLVGGLAEEVQVSAAIGAFLVGLALSGSVQARASAVVGPLRDLFAATFFLFFSFSVDPADLVDGPRPGRRPCPGGRRRQDRRRLGSSPASGRHHRARPRRNRTHRPRRVLRGDRGARRGERRWRGARRHRGGVRPDHSGRRTAGREVCRQHRPSRRAIGLPAGS